MLGVHLGLRPGFQYEMSPSVLTYGSQSHRRNLDGGRDNEHNDPAAARQSVGKHRSWPVTVRSGLRTDTRAIAPAQRLATARNQENKTRAISAGSGRSSSALTTRARPWGEEFREPGV